MAYATGTADNERDLLEKINKFLTEDETLKRDGQAWTVLLDRKLNETTTQKEIRQIAWKSTGTGVEQDIYLVASTDNLISADTYNLNFWGGTFFNQRSVTETQIELGLVNASPGVVLFADNRPIEYHIVANGRCCKIVTRISQVCSSAYLGFILPTVPPIEYPYPLCIAGSAPILDENNHAVRVRYSQTGELHSSVVDAKYGNCWLFTPDQSWRDFYGSSYKNLRTDSRRQALFPLCNYELFNSYQQPRSIDAMGESQGGAYPLIPVEFISLKDSSQGRNRWGAFDGVYWIPGIQRAAGDQVTIAEGRKGLVFNGGYRVATKDYFVIETTTEY